MRKIQYMDLQKKYAGKVVITDALETKVLAVGNKWKDLVKQLKDKGLEKSKYIIHGPIASSKTANVYLFLHAKENRKK